MQFFLFSAPNWPCQNHKPPVYLETHQRGFSDTQVSSGEDQWSICWCVCVGIGSNKKPNTVLISAKLNLCYKQMCFFFLWNKCIVYFPVFFVCVSRATQPNLLYLNLIWNTPTGLKHIMHYIMNSRIWSTLWIPSSPPWFCFFSTAAKWLLRWMYVNSVVYIWALLCFIMLAW